jgi:hypothetical protein
VLFSADLSSGIAEKECDQLQRQQLQKSKKRVNLQSFSAGYKGIRKE